MCACVCDRVIKRVFELSGLYLVWDLAVSVVCVVFACVCLVFVCCCSVGRPFSAALYLSPPFIVRFPAYLEQQKRTSPGARGGSREVRRTVGGRSLGK